MTWLGHTENLRNGRTTHDEGIDGLVEVALEGAGLDRRDQHRRLGVAQHHRLQLFNFGRTTGPTWRESKNRWASSKPRALSPTQRKTRVHGSPTKTE